MKVNDSLFKLDGCIAALGTFDGVHHGHRAVIKTALMHQAPVVVVTSKQNPRHILKGSCGRIISHRLCDEIFKKMGVSAVIRLDFNSICNMEPSQYLDMLCDKLGAVGFVCGFNFRFGKDAKGDTEFLNRYCSDKGLLLDVCDSVNIDNKPVSSTRIREALALGDIDTANNLLGDPYRIDFEVSHGDARGRSMGYPTINQRFSSDYTLPRFGVYASVVTLGDMKYAAVTNIGKKPTFGADYVAAETNICDFDGDIYGTTPIVEPIKFIRDEMKFDSVEALTEQIKLDRQKSIELINQYNLI